MDFSKIKVALSNDGINYSYKVKELTTDWSGNRSRQNFGSYGSNPNFEKQYVLSVSRKDVERATYLIQLMLNSQVELD